MQVFGNWERKFERFAASAEKKIWQRSIWKYCHSNGIQTRSCSRALAYLELVLRNALNSWLFPSKSKSGCDARTERGVGGNDTFIVKARLRS